MPYSKEELKSLMTLKDFPRSAKYAPEWMIVGRMGPNPVRLTESPASLMKLEPGMRVLYMESPKYSTGISAASTAPNDGAITGPRAARSRSSMLIFCPVVARRI